MNKEFCLGRPGKKRERRDPDPEGSFPLQMYERQHTHRGKYHHAKPKRAPAQKTGRNHAPIRIDAPCPIGADIPIPFPLKSVFLVIEPP
jgi:hypothetical protein